jgi:glycosyltransferase involved in cell wall biosynthesis
LTAGQRVHGWANYLHEHGYTPIVITRQWKHVIESPEDVLKSCGDHVEHIKESNYEVYSLPYKAGLRDRLFTKWKGTALQKLSRPLTFFNLFFENYTTRFISHRNIYSFAQQHLKNNPDIEIMIISGNPFNQFFFGYKLQKEFGIKWIADYRDDWNTSEIERVEGRMQKFIAKLQAKSERKWVGSASLISSVSEHYTDKISRFVNKEGITIQNGYELESLNNSIEPDPNYFTITYNGSLYSTQQVEPLLNALKNIISNQNFDLKIRIQFPGLGYDKKQRLRVESLTSEITNAVIITDRIPKEDVLNIQQGSDLLIMLSHTRIKGIPSSKLYEYIGLKKPILLFPTDSDIIESTLNDTGLGVICNSEQEIIDSISELILLKKSGQSLTTNIKNDQVKKYSRKEQTNVLANALDSLQS